jgi:hypothetical protein
VLFCQALLSSDAGGEYVTVEELAECVEAELGDVQGAQDVGDSWERDAVSLLQEAFASDFAKVSPSLPFPLSPSCALTHSLTHSLALPLFLSLSFSLGHSRTDCQA